MLNRKFAAAAIAAAACLMSNAALADDAPGFFAKKAITIMAGLSAGGGVDAEMRLVARYIPRHIPGNPTIIPRNIPGAGGATAGNQLYRAPPDGLTLGMIGRGGFLFSTLIKSEGVIYDLEKFSYIGAGGGTNGVLWLRSSLGVKTIQDLASFKQDIVLGSLGPTSQSAIVPRVLAKYQGWPLRVVRSYPGFSDVLLAIERGEADGLLSLGTITRPDMVTSGFLIPILQSGDDMPNLPIVSDIVTNDNARKLLNLLAAPARIGLPLMGPPAMPADRLKVLSKAFDDMMHDKEYLEEAEKRGFPVGPTMNGATLQKLVAENLTGIPEPVLEEYLSYAQTKDGQ
jgi:tripartite-type tricarboxylate transporter receptor subunit TctC